MTGGLSNVINDCTPDTEEIIVVYMMSNRFDGVVYTGVTAHLVARVQQHKDGTASRFTSKFCATSLVWWEPHALIVDAIKRKSVSRNGLDSGRSI